jgi:hypothetical protein
MCLPDLEKYWGRKIGKVAAYHLRKPEDRCLAGIDTEQGRAKREESRGSK